MATPTTDDMDQSARNYTFHTSVCILIYNNSLGYKIIKIIRINLTSPSANWREAWKNISSVGWELLAEAHICFMYTVVSLLSDLQMSVI